MRLKIMFISVSTALIVGFTGCSSKEHQIEFANAPKWVLTQDNEKGISGSGSAKIGKGGMSFAIIEAEANGRDTMTRQMQVRVASMVRNFTRQTGVGDGQTVDKVVSSVSRQTASHDLIGTQRKDTWISPSGEVWVLMSMSDQSVLDVKNAVKSSFKNDDALHQQMEAKHAQDNLDRELERL
ncbi:MAG: LPP20 family lipoprotein [Sulfurimonas sp.]|jgi:hypothetical protein